MIYDDLSNYEKDDFDDDFKDENFNENEMINKLKGWILKKNDENWWFKFWLFHLGSLNRKQWNFND